MTSVIEHQAQAESDLLPEQQPRDPKESLRRRFLKGTAEAMLGVVAIMGIDSVAGEVMWSRNDTSVEAYRPLLEDDRQDIVLTAPGLGMRSSEYVSKSLALLEVNSLYVNWPDHGASVDTMTKAAEPYIRDADSVSIVGASMGAPIMLEAMLESAREGVDRPLKEVIMISSPFDMDDARFTAGAKTLNFMYDKGYKGGPLGHTLYRSTVDWYRGNLEERSLQQEWQIIQYEINQGNPFSLTLGGIDMFEQIHLEEQVDEFALHNIITPETRFYYVRTENAADDRVVDVDAAQAKWQAFAGEFGAEFEVITIAGMQHGDVQVAIPVLEDNILSDR